MEESFSPCYNMSNLYRGHALIIVNERFRRSSLRAGARLDAAKMEALFKALDFHVSVFMNLEAKEMMKVIKKVSESNYNVDSDCFVLVLSSHGHEEETTEQGHHLYLPEDASLWRHAVMGTDDKPIYVDDVLRCFDSKINEQNLLNGKPKLFFIQACQSGHLANRGTDKDSFDTGVTVDVAISAESLKGTQVSDAHLQDDTFVKEVQEFPACGAHSGWQTETESWLPGRKSGVLTGGTIPFTADTEIDHPLPVPARRPTSYDLVALSCPEDCLVMYPSMSGKFAFRCLNFGSYMLHYMCQAKIRDLLLYGHDILQYVTTVNSALASTDINFTPTAATVPDENLRRELQSGLPLKVTACIIHRLTKSLKFIPKENDSVMRKIIGLSA